MDDYESALPDNHGDDYEVIGNQQPSLIPIPSSSSLPEIIDLPSHGPMIPLLPLNAEDLFIENDDDTNHEHLLEPMILPTMDSDPLPPIHIDEPLPQDDERSDAPSSQHSFTAVELLILILKLYPHLYLLLYDD